jgi:hypothetical protein
MSTSSFSSAMVSTFLLLGLAVDLGLSAAALEAGFLLAGLAEAAALEAGLSAAALVEAGLVAALVDLGLSAFSALSSLAFLLAGALAGASSAGRF